MSSKNTLSRTTLEYAEELTDAVLGLDSLYRDQSGDDIGLAVLNLTDGRVPEKFDDYAAARERFESLLAGANELPESDREIYYREFSQSMLAFIEWRQEGLPFPEQVERFLHVPAEPPSEKELASLREELRELLGEWGYEGSVSQRCTNWKDATTVPPSDVPDVLREEMEVMRSKTLSTLGLEKEGMATMDATGVSNAAFNAKCDFENRQVVINTDPQITRPWLRKLAVHEGYPGHVLQFSARKKWYEQGSAPADGLLSVVNCASSATFEGIADSGLSLLGSADTSYEAASLVGRYQAGIATAGAWKYHKKGYSESELRDWLQERAIYGDEGWVENRVKFVTAPERATLMWSYWHGEPAVKRVLNEIEPNKYEAFVRFLYGRMHSPDSVAEFLT